MFGKRDALLKLFRFGLLALEGFLLWGFTGVRNFFDFFLRLVFDFLEFVLLVFEDFLSFVFFLFQLCIFLFKFFKLLICFRVFSR